MLIKRYPNRKLYNTETKQYITLDELADLIRGGEEIHVLDHSTGEDLTDLTLTQILFEQVKKQAGFLPRTLLSGLIQAGGDRISALQRVLSQSLGLAGPVNTEIRRRVQVLVNRGEISEAEGAVLHERLQAAGKDEHGRSDKHGQGEAVSLVDQLLDERGLATRKELEALLEQVEALTKKIEELGG